MKSRSLFWTFAGVFLLVLAVATALQIVVNVVILRPLSESANHERVTRALDAVIAAITAAPDTPRDFDLMRLLHANRVPGGSVVLVYLDRDGRLIPERPLPPGMPPQIRRLAAAVQIAGAGQRPGRGTRPFEPPPGEPDFGGPPRGGPDGMPPPRGDDGRRGPPEGFEPPPAPGGFGGPDRPPGGDDEGPPLAPRDRRLVLLDHQPAAHAGQPIGEVIAIGTTSGNALFGGAEPRWLLLFVPFAVLAAAAAGLLMVRIVVHRLRALDRVAARVGEGDLAARVETTGGDEIGRLEARFNSMTERLGAARAQLEETDAQRRRLLANITHELATPLTTIRGYVETLLDPAVSTTEPERAGYLRDVLDEAKRLDALIGDLFDLARLEAGVQPFKMVRLDWAALCRNTVRRFVPLFRDAGLRLEWKGNDAEAWIAADGRRTEQVVENLLVNALRYVPAGGAVALSLERVTDGVAPAHRLVVRDDGPGIAPDDLPHIFDRFYRSRVARDEAGSGLGLAIVREIVERHGGQVRAEALIPRGAAFMVELPAAES